MSLNLNQKSKFEKWAVEHSYKIAEMDASGIMIYQELETRCAWQAWKASHECTRNDFMSLE